MGGRELAMTPFVKCSRHGDIYKSNDTCPSCDRDKASQTSRNSDTVRQEIEQIRRIVRGATKRLDRLCDEMK